MLMSVLLGMISKNIAFVILPVVLTVSLSGCNLVPSHTRERLDKERDDFSAEYSDAVMVGRIKSAAISESSGLASSRCNPGVLWTHNDSGNDNSIFALNEKGEVLATFRVTGTTNRDWEDMATLRDKDGDCFLFIGDIGNNGRYRDNLMVYKIPEPEVGARGNPGIQSTARPKVLRFSYVDSRQDAEALLVHPLTEAIYVITKHSKKKSRVYKVFADGKARKIAEIEIPSIRKGFTTGGDIDPAGTRVIVSDYLAGFEFVLTDGAGDFDEIWKQKPKVVDLGVREQGEAVAYSSDGKSVFATSEGIGTPIFKSNRDQ